ncbi:Dual specificity protein phosphatase cdc14a, partial [Borealophlyctis nickersoniae]
MLANKKLCLYSSLDSDKRANAAFLMCAYMLIVHNQTPDEAYTPLSNPPITPPFLPYRDAGYGAATYHITILDCLRGLHKSLTLGLLDLDSLDVEEYEFYERVENGDFNWLGGKFLALASPKDETAGVGAGVYAHPSGMQNAGGAGGAGSGVRTVLGIGQTTTGQTSYSSMLASGFTSAVSNLVSRPSYPQYSSQSASGPSLASPSPTSPSSSSLSSPATSTSRTKPNLYPAYHIDALIHYLKSHGVRTIIRLNNKIYDRKKFVEAGIDHVEMYFPDGTTPPEGILKRFLEICEGRAGEYLLGCECLLLRPTLNGKNRRSNKVQSLYIARR